MQAIWFDRSIPRALATLALKRVWPGAVFAPSSPLRYGNVEEGALPGPRWVRVRNRLSGICGSDLHLVHVDVDPMIHGAALPGYDRIYLGHETVGEVVEVGDGVRHVAVGDRVCLQTNQTCGSQEIDPPCGRCVEGSYALCENQSARRGPEGVGGGWSDGYVRHEDQVWKVPPGISDEQAVLIEPFSCGVRAVLRARPAPGDRVLVVGCGIIGLGVVQALRAVEPEAAVFVIARYPHQRAAALRLGAEAMEGSDPYEAAATLTGASLFRGELGNRTLLGGFDRVFDCVGDGKTLHTSLRITRAGGTVVVVGVHLHRVRLDLSPTWHQEVNVIGSLAHGLERIDGEAVQTFDLTARWMQQGRMTVDGLVTHRFPLARWRDAVRAAGRKRAGAIKVVFEW